MDPRDFKVLDANKSDQLDLSVPLRDQPYLIRCQNTGTTPILHLLSTIFRNAQQLEQENRALRRRNTQGYRRAARREGGEGGRGERREGGEEGGEKRGREGRGEERRRGGGRGEEVGRGRERLPYHCHTYLYRSMQSSPPSVPERRSSLGGQVTKDEELLFKAGRKPYVTSSSTGGTPTTHLAVSTSSSSLLSSEVGVGMALAEGDTMDRIFNGSCVSLANSEDSTSIQSLTSDHGGAGGGSQTPDSARRNLLRPMSAPGQNQGSSRSSSAPRPESPNPPG